MMFKGLFAATLGLMMMLGLGVFSAPQTANANLSSSFNNPIKINRGADPYVFKADDGYYYMVNTEGPKGIMLRRSTSIVDIAYGQSKTVYNFPSPQKDIWAPEIQQFDGVWYIYYTMTTTDTTGRRMYVLKCTDANPMTGTWSYVGQITDASNNFAIDGSVFKSNNQFYFLWSGWNGTDTQQRTYIASMSNPYTINSARTLIASPSEAWEQHDVPISEGPVALVKNGKVYVTYSGSQANLNAYSLGLLTASESSNLLDAASWTKTGPVFSQANGIYATGHNSFFKSPDGTEDWFAFNAVDVSGQYNDDRDVRIQKITWNGDVPNFGTPQSNATSLARPSGNFVSDRYEAENATLSGPTIYTTSVGSAYNGFTGNGYTKFVNNSGDSITFNVTAAAAGRNKLSFRYTNDTTTTNTLKVTVNGTVVNTALAFPSTGNGDNYYAVHYLNFSLTEPQLVNFNAGTNTVKIETTGNNGPWLDSLLVTSTQTRANNGGTVTASATNSPAGEEKEKAFDNLTNSKWLIGSATAWLQYDFAGTTSWKVNSYSITSANDDSTRDPKNWTLQGSNNGTSWTTIDTRTNETFSSRNLTRTFTSSNTTPYQMYRLNITANNGSSSTQLAELELFAPNW
jgi:GH43 family beta-xylosidase